MDPGVGNIDFDGPVFVGRSAVADSKDGKHKAVRVDLVIQSSTVSGLHARIVPDDTGLVVEDLASTNGTFVNDQRVTGSIHARHGDEVRFDKLIFTVADRRPAPTPPQADPVPAPKGTEVRPASPEVASPSPERARPPVAAEDDGKKGGTVVLQAKKGLPEDWIPPPGTRLISRQEDVERFRKSDEELKALADATTVPTLWLLSGSDNGVSIQLRTAGDMNFWNVGSDPNGHELDIVLSDDSVSGLHAKIVHREGRWKVTDLLSTNGVFVNDQKCGTRWIESQDRIRFGNFVCLFLLPGKKSTGPTPEVAGFLRRWWWLLAIVLAVVAASVAWVTDRF